MKGVGVNEFGNFLPTKINTKTGNRLLGYIGSRRRGYVCLDGGAARVWETYK